MTAVLDFAAIRAELNQGNRVLMLVRHAERPHIDKDDKTFGATLPLTENGKRMCVDFGQRLQGASQSVQFRASPLLRTVMTARLIAQGMGIGNPCIVPDDLIGNGSCFISDLLAVWELFRDGSFFEKMMSYMSKGTQIGFAPLFQAAETYEDYVVSNFSAQFGIFATHDIFVAAYLHAKGVKTDWNPDNWPRFLDSAVIIIDSLRRRRYALFRAGLSNLVSGVD
ncbi:MAG: histidine phosphatase family protein [Kiritimatiellae bacterium]|nr:histidine phosphatase family protein [Kiritimatiellia bacterium]